MRELITRAFAATEGPMTGENLAEFLQSDLSFHMTIIEAAGNPRLTKLAGDSHIHSRIFGVERFGHNRELLEEADRTHHAIFAALKQRDANQASNLVAQHIQRSLELTLTHIDHAPQDSWWQSKSARKAPGEPVAAVS
jgi:DNA-binding GntR family transcriptional regulator